MEINRRGFIARLIGGALLVKVLPESLLGAEPKTVTISLAEDTLPVATMDSTEFLRQLNAMTPNPGDFYFRHSPLLERLRNDMHSKVYTLSAKLDELDYGGSNHA